MLQLDRAVASSNVVAPILFSSHDNHQNDELLTGIGWAKGEPIGSRGRFEYLNGKSYGKGSTGLAAAGSMVLAVLWNQVGGARPGDSGGPLIRRTFNGNGSSCLHMGIESAGDDTSDLYTRTSYFADWIYETTGLGKLYVTQNDTEFALWSTNNYPQIRGFSSISAAGVIDSKTGGILNFIPEEIKIEKITSGFPVKICALPKNFIFGGSIAGGIGGATLAGRDYMLFIDFSFGSNAYATRFQVDSSEIQTLSP